MRVAENKETPIYLRTKIKKEKTQFYNAVVRKLRNQKDRLVFVGFYCFEKKNQPWNRKLHQRRMREQYKRKDLYFYGKTLQVCWGKDQRGRIYDREGNDC